MKSFQLTDSVLFQGTTMKEAESMLQCLQGKRKHFPKGTYLLHAGDCVEALGVVVRGQVIIEHNDLWGNKTILGKVMPGELFGEAYACTPKEPMMVSVVAEEETEVLYLDVNRILTTCSSTCSHHKKMIENLLYVLARKNQNLSKRILHTTSKSIRGRVIAFLSDQVGVSEEEQDVGCAAGIEVEIPYNRQQLADYLNVDRSALSNELSKMQKEGILKVQKNRFTMLE